MTDLTVKIVEGLADARGADVEAIEPLGLSLDPEALERLVASTAVPVTITVELDGWAVRVDEGGTVTVRRDSCDGCA